MLLQRFIFLLTTGWSGVFAQRRTLHRAIEHALSITTVAGRRTISRAILALGRGQVDWSADYRLFSRQQWQPAALFVPVIASYLERYPEQRPIAVALDDTAVARSGKHVPYTSWTRDPMSPPFHLNLIHAIRFVQISLLFPHHRESAFGARAVPIRFAESVAVKKPGKKASQEEVASYRQARRKKNLVLDACAQLRDVRADLDRHGAQQRSLIAAVDGSYCNRGTLDNLAERTELIARARKDARLCLPAPAGTRRFYDVRKFTPEQVRQDDTIAYQGAEVWIGGTCRDLRYKELRHVLWQRGARRRELRLFVLAPTPYKLSPNSRTHYRQPAYLLCTEMHLAAAELIQIYVDRWQIEVNHRDEKEILGIGQAQVWSENSVGRHPAFRVACYSMLMLAALQEFGIERTTQYNELPLWRNDTPRRASILDILTKLRTEIDSTSLDNFGVDAIAENFSRAAYG